MCKADKWEHFSKDTIFSNKDKDVLIKACCHKAKRLSAKGETFLAP